MRIIFAISFCMNLALLADTPHSLPWSESYQSLLMEKVGQEVPVLATYPSSIYPNKDISKILKRYPDERVLLFGYGSLLNPDSAGRTVGEEALRTKEAVVAFGFKRLFNYKASNVSRWGTDLPSNERAMLNIQPTTTFSNMINGAVMEVSASDLAELVLRETGYDLVPMLVANWDQILRGDENVEVRIAYTFLVPDELRNGIDYTQTKYYPVRGYLHASLKGASLFGPEFLAFWRDTTYLGDGTTSLSQWNGQTFSGILDSKEP